MFLLTLKQMGILLGYILLGYLLCRKRIVGRETSAVLSKLLIYVFGPAYTVTTLVKQLDIQSILSYLAFIGCGAAVVLIAIGIASVLAKPFAADRFQKNLYTYMFTFSNFGYLGYPLIDAVFGSEALACFMLFALPINLVTYSYGYYILTEDGEAGAPPSLKQRLKSIFPFPFIAALVGIGLGLLPIDLPPLFFDILSPARNCYSAAAMLSCGIALATYPPKALFASRKAYPAAAVRLLLIPLLFGGAAFALSALFGLERTLVICIVVFACLPAGMNVFVYPESVGKDSSVGAKAWFVTTLLSLITTPLWFYLLSVLL